LDKFAEEIISAFLEALEPQNVFATTL